MCILMPKVLVCMYHIGLPSPDTLPMYIRMATLTLIGPCLGCPPAPELSLAD